MTTNTDITQERADFETAYAAAYPMAASLPGKFDREDWGDYVDASVGIGWRLWQAGRAAVEADRQCRMPSDDEILALAEDARVWVPMGSGPEKERSLQALRSLITTALSRYNSSQPAASPEPVPDIPVGCEMTRNWSVTVCAEGADILTISSEYVAGVSDLEPWRSTIRGCAQHLLSFVGEAAPVAQEPVAWVRPDLVVNGKIQASSFTAHTNYRDGYVPLSLAAPVAAQVQPEGVTLDGCLETLFVIGEYLGVDYAASRKAPGAPSGVYIKAIEDRVAAQPSAQDREDAERVLAALDSGDWKITRNLPCDYLTDAANKQNAWMVERQVAPFCDDEGIRVWVGPTAIKALLRGQKAIDAARAAKGADHD